VLVANGANINKAGEDKNTPLHYAAMLGKLEAVRCLVALGALNLPDRYGNKPADLATDHEHVHRFLRQTASNQSLEPTAGRCGSRLNDDL
jgi:ankyrin repeat protein